MVGPPGVGKTMLARRLPGIMPAPTFEEALEITRIQSVVGLGGGRLARERPFRAPHHTISPPGLIGGGTGPRPGEITLAHRGVLFLDELAEFSRPALEALRQPLEHGRIDVTRRQRTLTFPAGFTLVAACNDCPCGRQPEHCACKEPDRLRYRRRLSGPLVDRIDLVCRLAPESLDARPGSTAGHGATSVAVAARVAAARQRAAARLAGSGDALNAGMGSRLTRRHVHLRDDARSLLARGTTGTGLSARGVDRVLRLARTIADLGGAERVERAHVQEALGYRLGISDREAG
jgi:magnesium chelatase family protein